MGDRKVETTWQKRESGRRARLGGTGSVISTSEI